MPDGCSICRATPVVAKGQCRRCYSRNWSRANPRTDAQKEARQARLDTNREAIWAAKDNPCIDCGGTFHRAAMDFDHRPDESKLFNLSDYGDRKLDTVLAEIAKCDLVCANCHRVRTFNRASGKGMV